MNNMKIGQRLGLGFGVVIALLIVLATISYARINSLSKEISLMVYDHYPKTALANTIKHKLNEVARYQRNALLLADTKEIDKLFVRSAENSTAVSQVLDTLDKMITDPKEREQFKALLEVREQFLPLNARFNQRFKENKKDEAREVLLNEVRPVHLKYFEVLEKFIAYQDELMASAGESSSREARSATMLILLLALAAAALSIVAGYLATRSITRPLHEAVGVARRVADGDLSSRIEVRTKDETGQLLQALKDMNQSLLKIVGEVRFGTDAIATASTQIASGNLDLSSRTEEQASSLEETASSMEELTSTVKQNADNAYQANALAVSASEVARKGGAVVNDVVATMGSINESARKISDIIGVIDGIAFQTNILALNAAVEAARAGEQGRGFAVVAAEVRNLAQRSAGAAKEIKTLINDSVEKVGAGTRLVDQAGATMQDIVDSVKRVTDIIGEITAASREQTAGIEQINQAIAQMDEVTQQNASLVEEAAAASEAMQEQAGKLASAVSVFKFDDAQGSALPAPATASVTSIATHPRIVRASAPAKREMVSPPDRRRAAGDEWEEF